MNTVDNDFIVSGRGHLRRENWKMWSILMKRVCFWFEVIIRYNIGLLNVGRCESAGESSEVHETYSEGKLGCYKSPDLAETHVIFHRVIFIISSEPLNMGF